MKNKFFRAVLLILVVLFSLPILIFAQGGGKGLCEACDPNAASDECGVHEIKDESGNVIETKDLVCVSIDGKTGQCEIKGEITFCPKTIIDGGESPLLAIIGKVINLLFMLAVIIAPLMLVVAGLIFMFSVGNYELREKVKSIIVWTIIGFVVIALSYVILSIIKYLLNIET
ncbi:hypothetical protein HRbin34_00062 [bacterium HR34]|nr:hypothetical protein HRbin34_00062 [bacterium HR34]